MKAPNSRYHEQIAYTVKIRSF
uniref:Uncharacterized protein n=1 Tax=Anguilla anguilla TaxID=7936 RepID=A0A0E9R9U7_ANGAN